MKTRPIEAVAKCSRSRARTVRMGGMAKGYVPVNRDQPFLLPPDMREWLGEWASPETVEACTIRR
ncbi:MAG: hypothetical protein GEU79_13430, partial [Acidimicrobiia bacterium]|nr:hypothetical protein [Acidimicrobiia bacterium]